MSKCDQGHSIVYFLFPSQEHGTSSTNLCNLFFIIVCICTSTFYLQCKGKSGFAKPRKILFQGVFYMPCVQLLREWNFLFLCSPYFHTGILFLIMYTSRCIFFLFLFTTKVVLFKLLLLFMFTSLYKIQMIISPLQNIPSLCHWRREYYLPFILLLWGCFSKTLLCFSPKFAHCLLFWIVSILV